VVTIEKNPIVSEKRKYPIISEKLCFPVLLILLAIRSHTLLPYISFAMASPCLPTLMIYIRTREMLTLFSREVLSRNRKTERERERERNEKKRYEENDWVQFCY